MIKELIKMANSLDAKGFTKEADALDEIIRMAQNGEGEYENVVERFAITDKNDGERESIVVQFRRQRGDRKSSIDRSSKSQTKSYRSNNKDIQYQELHAKTDNYKLLENEPYTMELAIKDVENGQEITKEVYRHTGLTMSPEIKQKYEEARRGLTTLDEKEKKLQA